jgi:CRP-like cAMP-binding protein
MRNECFRHLSAATQTRVAQLAEQVAFAAGHVIFQQGDPPSGLYMLHAGRAKIYRHSKDREQILAVPLPGDCFGAETLSMESPSSMAAQALTDLSAIYVHPDYLRHLLAQTPDFREVLLEIVSLRLRQYVSLVHDLAFRDVTSRLAMVLVNRARAEGSLTDDGIRIERLLSQQEFASMVGSAREVVNRVFKRLDSDGLVRFETRFITILNLEALTALAQQESR